MTDKLRDHTWKEPPANMVKTPMLFRHSDVKAVRNEAADYLEQLEEKLEFLEAKIDNANMAASETTRNWEERCHNILAALGEDYGDYEHDEENEHNEPIKRKG